MKTTAIILSAGEGKRLGEKTPKQYIKLSGRPILFYALKAFELSHINEIVIVCGAGDEEMIWEDIVSKYELTKILKVVSGGQERYDSVLAGLKEVGEDTDAVLIHDGARPFVLPGTIDEMIEYMETADAAIAAMPVKDTIKIADDKGFIESTTKRADTWMAQTPQAFKREMILNAYQKIAGGNDEQNRNKLKKYTDDAMIFSEVYPGKKVKLIEGGYNNIKITTKEDLVLAEMFVK